MYTGEEGKFTHNMLSFSNRSEVVACKYNGIVIRSSMFKSQCSQCSMFGNGKFSSKLPSAALSSIPWRQ